jgi:hypothetical protein
MVSMTGFNFSTLKEKVVINCKAGNTLELISVELPLIWEDPYQEYTPKTPRIIKMIELIPNTLVLIDFFELIITFFFFN